MTQEEISKYCCIVNSQKEADKLADMMIKKWPELKKDYDFRFIGSEENLLNGTCGKYDVFCTFFSDDEITLAGNGSTAHYSKKEISIEKFKEMIQSKISKDDKIDIKISLEYALWLVSFFYVWNNEFDTMAKASAKSVLKSSDEKKNPNFINNIGLKENSIFEIKRSIESHLGRDLKAEEKQNPEVLFQAKPKEFEFKNGLMGKYVSDQEVHVGCKVFDFYSLSSLIDSIFVYVDEVTKEGYKFSKEEMLEFKEFIVKEKNLFDNL